MNKLVLGSAIREAGFKSNLSLTSLLGKWLMLFTGSSSTTLGVPLVRIRCCWLCFLELSSSGLMCKMETIMIMTIKETQHLHVVSVQYVLSAVILSPTFR